MKVGDLTNKGVITAIDMENNRFYCKKVETYGSSVRRYKKSDLELVKGWDNTVLEYAIQK